MAPKDEKGWKTMILPNERAEGEAPQVLGSVAPTDAPAKRLAPEAQCTLEAISGPELGQIFTLVLPYNVIGRREHCEVELHDSSISGRHAVVFYSLAGEWRIEDLASTNGTRLNSVAVVEAALNTGDMIQIGESVLRFATSASPRGKRSR